MELTAAFFGLKIFASNYKNCQILLQIDNTTAISYINRIGGVQFVNLNKIAKDIWQWCEERGIWIFASYIASRKNIEADFESRKLESNTEIELSNGIFTELKILFGKPEIDIFASRVNAKCKTYISWKKDPEALLVDAFTVSWENFFFYAFPPCSVILKALQKIRNDHACGIMVVPEWPSQPWYPLFCYLLISEPCKFSAKNNLIFSSKQMSKFWDKVTLVAGILSAEL